MERAAYSIAQLVQDGVGSRSKLYEEINEGRLIARKRGRSTIILAEDKRAYLQSLPAIKPKVEAQPEAHGQRRGLTPGGRRRRSKKPAKSA